MLFRVDAGWVAIWYVLLTTKSPVREQVAKGGCLYFLNRGALA